MPCGSCRNRRFGGMCHLQLQGRKDQQAGNVSRVRFEVFTAVTMRMVSSGMLRRVALVNTDISEELNASFIRVTRISASVAIYC
jgi:hypothetical protein